jgi:two-component system osmolarity sensor histidine kinase EnvZ
MHTYVNSLDWLKSGLFWRTFFFLAVLVMASMIAWFASFKIVERTPRAQQLAAQIISVVTITRAALTHSAPDKRRELLFDLASNDGIRVYLLEDSDKVELPETTASSIELHEVIQNTLGKETLIASKVNDVAGFWVSFDIDDDQYWLRLDQERVTPSSGLQFIGWAAFSLFLTLIGAVFISKLINDPLSRLSSAALLIAKGKRPSPLPEKGPNEIRETNASFNQMMDDLTRIDSDRAVILAGISHDLRTPLTRMQLEVEMANLTAEARQGMQFDLSQMDGIIGQFLDYAKPLESVPFDIINISALLENMVEEASRLPEMIIRSSIVKDLEMLGNTVELFRLFNNLFENAKRYGKSPGSNGVNMDIQCSYKNKEKKQGILISIRDHGVGVPESDITRMLRPFTRVDISRSQANGSGLGLAIVDRIVKRHEGRIRISNHANGGFLVVIAF